MSQIPNSFYKTLGVKYNNQAINVIVKRAMKYKHTREGPTQVSFIYT